MCVLICNQTAVTFNFFIHSLILNVKSLRTTNVQPNIQEQMEQAGV